MNQSPLANRHLAENAKMADFGGWLMPIEYPATGAIAEYTAVRERVGLFDVSHLGKVSIIGVGAIDYLNKMVTNDLTKIAAGQAQYTTVKNLHKDYAVLALQGADSAKVLSRLGIDASLDYMSFINAKIDNLPVILCRTGYTGEFGFEIIPRWNDAEQVWDKIALIVKEFDGAICGLGARDLLRTEMGYPLHGHELTLSITPVEAGASWAVGWSKDQFRGKKVLTQQKEQGSKLRLKAILATERGIPRKDMQVKNLKGELIGSVTSGTYSPALKKGIGLALINSDVKKDDQVLIDIRGTDSTFKVVSLPFVPSKVR